MIQSCPICGDTQGFKPFLKAPPQEALRPDQVLITDADYGRSAPLVRCPGCGFVVADPMPRDLLEAYAGMDDPDYADGEGYRRLQMAALLDACFARTGTPPTLLDIGAGTGILVDEARSRGIDAVGVEPSHALAGRAVAAGRPVLRGVWPHPEIAERRFAAVTLVDVLEHVEDPVALLTSAAGALAPGGTLLVVTPDVDSLPRRLLGGGWWHFRLAHVNFLPLPALDLALRRAGLHRVGRFRPGWVFSLAYLAARGASLAGFRGDALRARLEGSRRLGARLVHLNPRDSWAILAEAP